MTDIQNCHKEDLGYNRNNGEKTDIHKETMYIGGYDENAPCSVKVFNNIMK